MVISCNPVKAKRESRAEIQRLAALSSKGIEMLQLLRATVVSHMPFCEGDVVITLATARDDGGMFINTLTRLALLLAA